MKITYRNELLQNYSLPSAVILDIDGTIALNYSGRDWYSGKNMEKDDIYDSMHQFIKHLQKFNPDLKVLVVTGRHGTETIKSKTETWFLETDIKIEKIFYRNPNDYRKSEITKKEIYNDFIKDKYYIEAVFEDDQKCVDMWRQEGLLCLQVWDSE